MKRIANKQLVACGSYVLLSLVGIVLAHESGAMPHWSIQAVMGPAWHLVSFVSVCQSPFRYLDGVVRVSREVIILGSINFLVWSAGLFFVALVARGSAMTWKRKSAWVVFILFWILTAWLNIYLYALGSL